MLLFSLCNPLAPIIPSLDELIEVLQEPIINDTEHFCECLELPPFRCDKIMYDYEGDLDGQLYGMVELWWWSFERLQRTWQKIVNALTCHKLYVDAVHLAKKKGGESWEKLIYKSPIPPYMFISVLSIMREIYNGTLPHPRPQS